MTSPVRALMNGPLHTGASPDVTNPGSYDGAFWPSTCSAYVSGSSAVSRACTNKEYSAPCVTVASGIGSTVTTSSTASIVNDCSPYPPRPSLASTVTGYGPTASGVPENTASPLGCSHEGAPSASENVTGSPSGSV